MEEARAIPLIQEVKGSGLFFTDEAERFLSTVNVEAYIGLWQQENPVSYELASLAQVEAPVAVISVAGLYRTGKSFLLNRILIGRPNGFRVGSTVNACTKGIWIWSEVLTATRSDGSEARFLLLDTEGIGALDTEAQYDASIFALALLLSSYFVYNSVGSIEEGALNSLSLIANLTQHIRVRGGGGGGDGAPREEDGSEFASHFPAFLWLVRDFALQLAAPDGRPITPKEYLEVARPAARPRRASLRPVGMRQGLPRAVMADTGGARHEQTRRG